MVQEASTSRQLQSSSKIKNSEPGHWVHVIRKCPGLAFSQKLRLRPLSPPHPSILTPLLPTFVDLC